MAAFFEFILSRFREGCKPYSGERFAWDRKQLSPEKVCEPLPLPFALSLGTQRAYFFADSVWSQREAKQTVFRFPGAKTRHSIKKTTAIVLYFGI